MNTEVLLQHIVKKPAESETQNWLDRFSHHNWLMPVLDEKGSFGENTEVKAQFVFLGFVFTYPLRLEMETTWIDEEKGWWTSTRLLLFHKALGILGVKAKYFAVL